MLNRALLLDFIALIAGMMLPFAFAPFNFHPLAFIAMILLLTTWLSASRWRGFWRGWLFGLGQFGVGVSWVYISIHTFGQTNALAAFFLTSVFVSVLAIFPAIAGFVLGKYFPTPSKSKILCAFPGVYLLIEWIRTWIFSGFPWLLVGDSQLNSPLQGFIPIMGAQATGLLVLLIAGLILCGAICFNKRPDKAKPQVLATPNNDDQPPQNLEQNIPLSSAIDQLSAITKLNNIFKNGFYYYLAAVFVLILGSLLSFIPWTKTTGAPATVTLIQGNISQHNKWSPEKFNQIINRYVNMTKQHWASDIIIWPEAAIPTSVQNAQGILSPLNLLAKQHDTTIVLGIPRQVPASNTQSLEQIAQQFHAGQSRAQSISKLNNASANNQGNYKPSTNQPATIISQVTDPKYYNSMIAIGNNQATYDKRRLVPFGEFLPLEAQLQHLANFFKIATQFGDLVPGQVNQSPFIVDGYTVLPAICYEIAFAEQMRSFAKGTDLIINISDDSWFGHSFAGAQQREIAQLRAVEIGRYALVASNTGFTSIINNNGKILAQSTPYTAQSVTGQIMHTTGTTPWMLLGAGPWLLLLIVLLFAGYKFQLPSRNCNKK